MAEVKWIKITTNMFEDEKIDFIESLPEADAILIIWIKLLTLAGKCNAGGFVFLTEKIPYTEEMLSHKFRRPLNTVKLALKTLLELEMIEFDDDSFLKITNWNKHQNIEGLERIREQNRLRQQKYRDKQKALKEGNKKDNVKITLRNETDIEVEEEVDIDKEVEAVEDETAAAALYDDGYKSIIKTFSENIHPPSPIESERLSKWMDDMEVDVIMAAIEEAVVYNRRNIKYIEGILNNWLSSNVKTKLALDAYKRDWQDKKQKEGQAPGGLNKQVDFANYEQHEYSDDDLKDLFVDIGG
ncbi:MAG TPA: DnaD domain protein [Tissierellia bacterium]|nr:DnaD domain protein [Tissierellia bacterium]